MKNYFNFNFSQRNGIIFLSIMLVLVFFIGDYRQSKTQEKFDFSDYKQQVELLKNQNSDKKYVSRKTTIKKKKEPKSSSTPIHLSIEINTIDSIGLKQLPAIGSVFAQRICKFRNILGGFSSINQLLEVYGMDSARFRTILPYLTLDINQLKTLDINTISSSELKNHPYISYKESNAIVSYRQQHGVFKTLSDLLEIHLIDSIKLCKIAPYLSINDSNTISQKY